ncbi:uncharacterized protein [Drosophila bipectinata]|uniref:uncharacterized protein n=1 Tax=Drosophila bipectinata TaxID=42026 RepID=UPI001C89CFDF|nr:uncharacterized protein LOC108119378 [Drosophila bipectinata]
MGAFMKLTQIAYATTLLLVIMATPKVVLHLELGKETTTATFEYPTVADDFMVALGLTLMAMIPIHFLPERFMLGNPKLGLIAALPWAASALTNFISNFSLYFRVFLHLARGNKPGTMFSGMMIYIGLFITGIEQVEWWLEVYSLLRKQYILSLYFR